MHYLQPHQPYIGAIKLIDSIPGGRVGAKVLGVKWDNRKEQYVLRYVEKLLPYLKGKNHNII